MDTRISSVVIVGGGTAGWMTAASLAARIGMSGHTRITLVESDQIGTIGVGEATVPALVDYLRKLEIDETDFITKTNATFKLAIGFQDWAGKESLFFHPFADIGVPIAKVPFQTLWTKMRQLGRAGSVDDYNLGSQLAMAGKFAVPVKNPTTGSSMFNYALHFDANLAARYLSSWARIKGVERIEGKVASVRQDPESGFVQALELEDGSEVQGDLFVDCTGFRGLLIEQLLKTGYEDWGHWLPCDRAVAMPCASSGPPPSYTRALAKKAGWQWRIPLQHRVGNGHVYSSDYVSDEEAVAMLEAELGGEALGDPLQLRFRTGVRKKFWNKNVYAIGLSAGFLEPLESTGIYLIQTGISLLLSNFPSKVHNQLLQDEVNAGQRHHWERIRDFIILHYWKNGRAGEPFWDACRAMEVPDELAYMTRLYAGTGRLKLEESDFFQSSSWHYLYTGFGIVPERYHPSADDFDEDALATELRNMAAGMADAAQRSPMHGDFIAQNCAAERT